LIIPQVTFAAWWNPLSWFNGWQFLKSNPQTTQEATTTPQTGEIIQMTREEFKAKYGFEPDVSKKEVVTQTEQKSQPNKSVSTNEKPVSEWVKIIDEYIVAYQNSVFALQTNSKNANGFKDNYLQKIGEMDWTAASLLLATTLKLTTTNQGLIESLNAKISELQKARSEMLSSNKVNASVWNENKMQELIQLSAYVTTAEDAIVKEYLKNKQDIYEHLSLIVEYLKSGYSAPSAISVQENPYTTAILEYNQKLSQMRSQIKSEIESAGGFVTASQLESLAMQRLKEAGVTVPTSPYGGLNTSTSNYTSIKCNSLQGGYDCYGSDGSRIQSIPIPGSNSFQINQW